MAKKDDEPQSGGLDYTQAKIRMPVSLRELLGEKAQQNSNTLNAEIISRLQSSLAAEQSLGDPEMIALWADLKKEIDYAEQATGRNWRGDTATYVAAKELIAAQILRFRPPMENQEEIHSTSSKYNKKQASLNARLEILERCGVIKKPVQNALAALAKPPRARGIFSGVHKLSYFPNSSLIKAYKGERQQLVSDEVTSCGYQLAVDLDVSPESWSITDEDGNKAAPGDGAAMAALLNSIPKASNDVREALNICLAAYVRQHEAEALGKAIAKDKLQGPTLKDEAAEGEEWPENLVN